MEKLKLIAKSLWTRINNKGTFLAISAFIITLLIEAGVKVDSDKVMSVVQIICTLLIALGVLNDPTQNSKPYIPYVSDKFIDKTPKEEKTEEETKVEAPAEENKPTENIM